MHICKCGLTPQPGNCLPIPTLKQCMCSFSKNSSRNVTFFDKRYFEWKCPIGAKCTYQNNLRYRPWFPKYIEISSSFPLPSRGWFCGEASGKVVVILMERVMQRLVVEQDGCFWLAVLACHWAEVFKALMAMVVSLWCRILGPARQDLRATLTLLCYFYFRWLYSCVRLVSL